MDEVRNLIIIGSGPSGYTAAQAEKFGAEFITDDVTRVELGDRPTEAGTEGLKTVWVGDKAYFARGVILSTGSAWRPIGIPGERYAPRPRRARNADEATVMASVQARSPARPAGSRPLPIVGGWVIRSGSGTR